MKILVVGDSHSRFMNITSEMRDCLSVTRGLSVRVMPISGATITGFGKRASTLDSYGSMVDIYHQFNPDYVCFALGQVDIELGYFYRKVIKEEQIEYKSFIDGLVANYAEKCNEFVSSFNPKGLSIKGVNLSTLTESRSKAVHYTSRIIAENVNDDEQKKHFNKQLREFFPSNIERNSAHLYFNKSLKEMCLANGFNYFDIVEETSDLNSLSVSKQFIPCSDDHHLLDSLYVRECHLINLVKSLSL
ncbi:hypothetical protein [Aliiglaciecola lipolytica]|uniref:hypothetical protein n=1 Tax=Aliiglaciecola lipolytica TaxID=477689 RepID=UPI001C083F3A|nr:hypothetical protein [Aliiglaciecola lipolytica]MBU2877766.1 hypothetical protein [Aliiglaciecola lipolytica]